MDDSKRRSVGKAGERYKMIEIVIMGLLYWFSLFFGGYSIPTRDGRGVLLMALFYIGGMSMYLYQLVVGSMVLPSSLPSSVEVGAMGLFLIIYLGVQ